MTDKDHNSDLEKYRQLLFENMRFIEERCYRAYGLCASRYGDNLTAANKADSLVVEVMDHISADGYRVLRDYRGRASLKRYLDVVICNKVIDIYRKKEGRSRAADEARKMGDAGRRLFELINDNALPVEEAFGIMKGEGSYSGELAGLEEMAARIESRRARSHTEIPASGETDEERRSGAGYALMTARSDAPDPEAQLSESEAKRDLSTALTEVLEELTPEERLMISLRYMDGRDVRTVAAAIGHTEKNTYKKLGALMEKCRAMLVKKGVRPEDLP